MFNHCWYKKNSSSKFLVWKFVFISTKMKTYVFFFSLIPIHYDHLHPFGHNLFTPFWSRSRHFYTLSVMIHSHSFGHDPFEHFWSWHLRTLWIITYVYPSDHSYSYLLDYDTFISLRSKQIYTSSLMTPYWYL